MRMTPRLMAAFPLLVAGTLSAQTPAARSPAPYKVGVVSESGDIVSWFIPDGPRLIPDRVVPVGLMPTDPDGPHNIAVSADQKWYYISIAHGTPYGSLWKLDATNDTVAGRAPLEMYPTTIGLTPDGEWALVANSDFFGDRPKVNPATLVHVPDMTTISDFPACDMPHGSRSNHAGTAIYLTCMHSDEILEFDTGKLAFTRRAMAGPGMPGMAGGTPARAMPGMDHGSAPAPAAAADSSCQPTYVAISPDDRSLYIACNHSSLLEVMDVATMTVQHRVATGAGAYNVDLSPDASVLVVTNKKGQSVSLIDPRTWTETARIPTTKKIVHGVAFSPDSRYAYISQESIGADPGAIDVIDLSTRQKMFTIPVPAQPTGIVVWRRPN
jgi:DNA-binding beta-propeller fold protein YncE